MALRGNHLTESARLTSRAAADMPLRLQIVFAPRNPAALRQLLSDLQNPASPHYHHWLTPAQFNARFGRTPDEVAAVREWLRQGGLRITRETNRHVGATATVAQAEKAFNVEILASQDGAVYGNRTDPEVPAQLAGIIASIDGLDNTLHSAPLGSASQPDYSGAYGTAFGPSDLWTFYDETPLLNGGVTGGGGDCLAVVEDSDYLDSAVSLFDSTFSLPSAAITRVLADGSSPGRNGDEVEVLLDIEWAHAVATGAPISVYIGNSGNSLLDAINRAVSDNKCGAISISYGYCGGSASFYTGTLDSLFSQAAAQGQSVFVSTGDQGAAGLTLNSTGTACVTGTSMNVSEMAADPNVTAVGGTQFHPNYSGGSDVGSVPESVWNDPSGAGGGGKSQYFAKPSYQSSGTPSDGARDIPDVANAASPYYPGFYWGNDSSGNPVMECCIGGTSLAAPLWAGLSKLVAQEKNGRAGNMNPHIYQLGPLGAAQSGLRDVLSGNNSYNNVTGYSASAGFDLASGWGSADMATFVPAFIGATPTPTATPTTTPTSTPTATPAPTPTATTTPIPTPTPTPTPRRKKGTPTPTPTATASGSPTPTPTSTPTPKGHHK